MRPSLESPCPEAHRWQAFLDEGPGEGDERLGHHLESCAACRQTLDELAAAPNVWHDTLQLTEGACTEPALQRMVERLKSEDPLPADEFELSFLSPAAGPDLLGMLGPYQVQRELGRGGMGVVFQAHDPTLDRTVAIKVLSPCLASHGHARQRFMREGRAAAAVAHENIVPVYAVSEVAGLPYLVMQHVAGESLQDRLDRGEPLEVADIVRIGLQVASGLAAAHAKGLIHRDIKPANLLLEAGGARVMITDFGLARAIDDVKLTQAGVVTGTPEFMAPEQARGESVDHRADLFSLGSVLHAMCTGRPPFAGSTLLGVLRQVAEQAPIAVRSLNPRVPRWLEEFIARLMQKGPADRLQSAAEAAALLQEYLLHLRQPSTTPPPRLPPRLPPGRLDPRATIPQGWACVIDFTRRNARRAALGAAGALILALCVLAWLGPFRMQPRPEQKVLAARLYHDFRGGTSPPVCARLTGLDDGVIARPEDAGFRITLPPNQQTRVRVGLELAPTITGDFEITAGYQILDADSPRKGEGVGAELYVGTAPRVDGLGVLRLTRAKEGSVYMVNRSSLRDGKLGFRNSLFPATESSGHLRLTRHGKDVAVAVAEGAAGELRELCRYELGSEDVTLIWLTAFAGGSKHGVDLRIVDVEIRAEGVTADGMGEAVEPDAVKFPRGWAIALVIIGVMVSGLSLGLWRYLRHSTGAIEPIPVPLGSSSITCPGCAKSLRVRPALEGKSVRCPHCGETFRVDQQVIRMQRKS